MISAVKKNVVNYGRKRSERKYQIVLMPLYHTLQNSCMYPPCLHTHTQKLHKLVNMLPQRPKGQFRI